MDALRFNFSHPVQVNAHLVSLSGTSTLGSRLSVSSDESNLVEIPIDQCIDGCWKIELEWEYENDSFYHQQYFEVKNHQLSS